MVDHIDRVAVQFEYGLNALAPAARIIVVITLIFGPLTAILTMARDYSTDSCTHSIPTS